MRVKIGDRWHDSRVEPIAVEVSAGERQQIYDMAPGATRYAQCPDHGFLNRQEFTAWLGRDAGAACDHPDCDGGVCRIVFRTEG